MANLLNIGISGLAAAQVGLNTVGNNISNSKTDGSSMQVVQQTARLGTGVGRLTIGSGVDVTSVQRAYSQYLTSAVLDSNAGMQRATAFNNLTSTLNNTLSSSGNLQGALDNFYGAFSTVASAPGSNPDRQALLGSANSLTAVFNTLGQQLGVQQSQVNSQITGTVASVNSIIGNIANLNQQIRQTSIGGAPNALLDQRDGLVKTLSGYLGVTAVTESDGSMSVYTKTGQGLVSGSNAYPIASGNDVYDTGRTEVYDTSGNDITSRLSGGSLGALLDYRSNVLDPIQNQLGQAALALAGSVNDQQEKGLDLGGNQGAPIFSVPTPAVLGATSNQGSAAVAATVSDVSQLTASDYVLRYDGSAWNLHTTGGQSVPLTTNTDGTLSAAGLNFAVTGTAQAGDSYQIQPTRNAAAGMAVSMTNPAGIAAAAALTGSAAGANTGSGSVAAVSVSDPGSANLLGTATISFSAPGTYQITDSSGTVSGTYTAGQPISANGWSLTLAGTPAAGDTFTVAANTNGLNDNSNALTLANLASTGVLAGGSLSVLTAYANITTQIGTAGSQAATTLTTQTALYNQATASQQSLSGVNLDEEAAKLVDYQQSYQASAQVIAASQTIFSSLLNAIRTA
ncbi:MAG: flagellar hook-associated protein FlgK [Rhodanobacter sp.]